jgi:biopolymer transport protein ExbD
VLEVLPGGVYAVNKEEIPKDRLPARLKEIYDPRPEKIMFVKGDPTVKYQDVIWSMDVARGAGVKVLGVPPKETSGAAPAAK